MKRFIFVLCLLALLVAPVVGVVAQDGDGDSDGEMMGCPPGPVPEDAPVIKFGAAVSDTGKYAREGGDTRNGYTLWLEWVNEEHGGIYVDGTCYRAEIIFYDDESDPDTVSVLTERLIVEDGVDFILGPYSSSLTQVASVITERENVIMVEGNGASDSLFERGFQNLFAVLTPASYYTRSGIELAYEMGARTAVVAYEDTAFPTSVAEGAQHWLEELGFEILAVESYPKDVTDVTAMFTNFRELDPDLFVGGGHFNDAVLFLNTARELGFEPDAFLITVGPSNPTFVEEMGDTANFVLGAAQWDPSLAYEDEWFGSASDYAERYEERFGIPPSYQAAESTATALVLHQAIEMAGSLDTDAVRQALLDMELETFYGPIDFDETGKNVGKPMVTIQIQDGEILVVAPEDAAVAEPVWPMPGWDER
ncbi:MAG: branched-chain amino acid ABC transporter substrate-binding protein [Chloroflexi bacterium]|nr:MAG: branched-chain amino acid ABC transporter substrate-binding protein [Chloroflexota bacterium]